jgi:hypothetical protein
MASRTSGGPVSVNGGGSSGAMAPGPRLRAPSGRCGAAGKAGGSGDTVDEAGPSLALCTRRDPRGVRPPRSCLARTHARTHAPSFGDTGTRGQAQRQSSSGVSRSLRPAEGRRRAPSRGPGPSLSASPAQLRAPRPTQAEDGARPPWAEAPRPGVQGEGTGLEKVPRSLYKNRPGLCRSG